MTSPTHESSMVGRAFDAQGNDQGDATFHERDMGFTTDVEAADLAHLRETEIDDALAQVRAFASHDPALGASAYQHVINLYPNDPRVPDWKRTLEELRKT